MTALPGSLGAGYDQRCGEPAFTKASLKWWLWRIPQWDLMNRWWRWWFSDNAIWANLAIYGGVTPLRGLHGDGFIKPSSARVLYSGWCPRKGVYFPCLRWAGGAIPHPFHHPKN